MAIISQIIWKTNRSWLLAFTFVAAVSTLLSGYVSEAEWMDKIKSGVASIPRPDTTWAEQVWGSRQRTTKPTVSSFLSAYNAWKNSTKEEYCTPSVEQISVTMDGKEISSLEYLDVSQPHILRIESWCDGIPGVGDFYETLLTSPYYHGRITLYNQFDGVQVGEPVYLPFDLVEQASPLRLRIWRLYREFEGIENHRERHGPFADGQYTREMIADAEIPLRGEQGQRADERPICGRTDFDRHEWVGGFWWRAEQTDDAWTFYLPHCKAKKFTTDEASECLAGRKLVYLGDSTAQDMVRNTFWTMLGDIYPDHSHLPRDFGRVGHWNTSHPGHPERWTSMSYLFNGHYDLGQNRLGMNAFRYDRMIASHDEFFAAIANSGAEVDTLLINSGLHDCWMRPTPETFAEDFAFGWEYYMRKFGEIKARQAGGRTPQVVYRYSNTPPLHLNSPLATPMNPSSMEMVNLIEREYLDKYNKEKMNGKLTYLDSFEPTWPWHFDGEMNSGPHYGRAPWGGRSKRLVDVMMVQLFFTRLCPDIALREEGTR